MELNKISIMWSNLVKFKHSHHLQKVYFGKIRLKSFNLSAAFYSNKPENVNSLLSVRGKEQIQALKFVSKKGNKLSVVEEKDIELVEDLKKGNFYHPYKSPMDRVKSVLIEDGKVGLRQAYNFLTNVKVGPLEVEYFHRFTDILIVGGGIVGLLIAFTIRTKFPNGPSVIVVDKSNDFCPSNINLGVSMVTPQVFNCEEEIPILQYGTEFFSSFTRETGMEGKPEFKVGYDPLGSLVLADVTNAEAVLSNNEILKMHGIHNKILSASVLKDKFPWLKLDDVLFGSLGMFSEGTIDPRTFFYGLKCKCINCGVHFASAEVIDFGYKDDIAIRALCKLADGSYNTIDFSYCVIAGGIESLNLVDLFNNSSSFNLALKLPLEERLRFEYCFYTPDGPGLNTPIVLDSEGAYFRRLGLTGHYVTGVSSIVNSDNLEIEPFQLFQQKIEPFLTKRLSKLNEIQLVNGWINAYDFCFSNNVGIAGPHPESGRIVFALGFSHFGLSLLPALARATMEYIFYDDYQTIDFKPFHIENLWRKQHLEADKRRRELLESQQKIMIFDGSERQKIEAN